jgi:pyridoxine kinase
MTILSIQSHVAYGHVGNAAAVLPLQRLGFEAWPVNTVQFSNHPGHGGFRGRVFEAEHIAECVAGIADRGVLGQCRAVLSGYLGSRETGAVVLDAVSRVKAANAAALFACDPVMGDAGPGLYVKPELVDFFRAAAMPLADILTPNLFELGVLAGRSIATSEDLHAALDTVHAQGPRVVLVTSAALDATPDGMIDVIVSAAGKRLRLRTPLLDCRINGAGDCLSALFLGRYLQSGDPVGAATLAVSSIHAILTQTAKAGSREMLLIAAQEEIVAPSWLYEAEVL